MRTRLATILILLVLLPTAVLSIMAGRALLNWGVVLQRRIESSAENAIRSVGVRMEERLDAELGGVRSALADCLVRGGAYTDIQAAAKRLEISRPLVRRVYLFMNPWDFVYPEEAKEDGISPSGDLKAEVRAGEPYLAATLRREIASARAPGAPVRFAAEGGGYSFTPIGEGRGLYAGFGVSMPAVTAELSRVVADLSGRDFALHIIPESTLSDGGASASVVVSDSLGGRGGSTASRAAFVRPLAEGNLRAPLDFIRIAAYPNDPDAAWVAGKIRARLYGWGIVLLAAGILAGVWLLLRETVAEIRRVRTRSDFVVGISHDLRTPIASMKVLAESLYLEHVKDPAKQKQFLGTIVRECERLSHLVERVLFFVRYGQHALFYRMKDLDAGEVVASAVDAYRSRFGESGEGPDVRVRAEPSLPRVKADATALTQVILNLLDNAEKYGRGEADASRLRIDVTVGSLFRRRHRVGIRREWVRVAVRDYGMGIGHGEQRKLFTPFYRTARANEGNVSGVGLGLTLCRHIVLSHGGWIEVASEYGKGSVFSVYLPASS